MTHQGDGPWVKVALVVLTITLAVIICAGAALT